jgi:ribosomal protein S18 acetylase RimI-like enzyme
MLTSFDPILPADVPLFVDFSRELYEFDGTTPFDAARCERALRQMLASPTFGRAFWIERGSERAGYLVLCFGFSLEFGGRDAFVDELYLREPFRGLGLGMLALEHAEVICREENSGALHLEVEFSNERAQSLYKRRGFEDHNRFLWTKWL